MSLKERMTVLGLGLFSVIMYVVIVGPGPGVYIAGGLGLLAGGAIVALARWEDRP